MARVHRFNFEKLDAYQAAVDHFAWTLAVFDRVPRASFAVRDQVQKAALSTIANIGEANGRDLKPGESEQHYRYAQGSTYESAAFLDALAAMGAIDDDEVQRARGTPRPHRRHAPPPDPAPGEQSPTRP